MSIKNLQSNRLIYRDVKRSDLELYIRLHTDHNVMQYVGPVWNKERAIEEFEKYFEPWLDLEDQWLSYIICDQQNMAVGLIGLKLQSSDDNRRELGFMILPEGQGFGYATEAASVMLDVAFNILGSHKVVAVCDNQNQASKNVLLKNMFVQEGLLREQFNYNGRWVDDAIFSILQHEYEA
ncbi:GNAT family N-acetyltransferase [Algibacillus agarilyticus]|uniref:GNAT family N-acetyltransferase n=1 Tax=Algibacillus agarilyticus TaxID=2234133 RepID=UPI000DD050FB|nr:GNAT family N-acetyltransferase [Algibacillus agarilyticus]